MRATVLYLVSRYRDIVNKRIWFVVVFGEPEIKCHLDSESGCNMASTRSWPYFQPRKHVYCWSSSGVVSAESLWPDLEAAYHKSNLFQYKQLTLSSFNRPLSGREWKAISIRAMRSPGDRERKQEMQRRKWETERGRMFPFIITISSSFCSVVVTGSIASITVLLSAM